MKIDDGERANGASQFTEEGQIQTRRGTETIARVLATHSENDESDDCRREGVLSNDAGQGETVAVSDEAQASGGPGRGDA